MTENQLKERWSKFTDEELKNFLISSRSPFNDLKSELIDFRGFSQNSKLISNLNLNNIDFSYSNFSNVWVEKSKFINVLFNCADLSHLKDHGNLFENVNFRRTNFKWANLGYKGSKYENVKFDRSNFVKTGFIRADFSRCFFVNCKLKGNDFNASTFTFCKFEGKLDSIRFRGGNNPKYIVEFFGQPKVNKMEKVSFKNAQFNSVMFSDNCDLSSVKIPDYDGYYLVENFNDRIIQLEAKLDDVTETEKEGVELYIKIFKKRSEDQYYYIINLEELMQKFGVSAGRLIFETLKGTPI